MELLCSVINYAPKYLVDLEEVGMVTRKYTKPTADTPLLQPPCPTLYLPGTPEKVEVMRIRVNMGFSPFHPKDTKLNDLGFGPLHPGYTLNERVKRQFEKLLWKTMRSGTPNPCLIITGLL